MPAEVEPPQLARLLDYAERARAQDWSLRSSLVRYAQPEPGRSSALLQLVRRIDAVVHPQLKAIERDGTALWDALQAGSDEPLVGLLGVMAELDRLGDRLAGWAVDPTTERPDADVDAATAEAARRLDALGVPHEERQRPPRQRGV